MPANSDDIFTGSDGVSDFLEADGGNDTLYGYGYSDRLVGGSGNDHLYGGDDFDYLFGGDGNDYLYADNDATVGHTHGFQPGTHVLSDFKITNNSDISVRNDAYKYLVNGNVLNGGSGNDFLYVTQGNNTLLGGGDTDYILDAGGDYSDDADTYEIYYDLSNENASVNYVNTIIDEDDWNSTDTVYLRMWERAHVKFTRQGRDLVIEGHFGGNTGDAYAGGKVIVKEYFSIWKRAHNKTFVFGPNEEVVDLAYMQSGLLRFDGPASNLADNIVGTDNSDYILARFGNDVIDGRGGDDRLYGEDGADVIYGGDGKDWLEGGVGNDSLDGQGGNDTLYGKQDNDRLYGGTGSDTDTYVFGVYGGAAHSDGQDTIIDLDDTAAVDIVQFMDINSSTVTFSRVGDDLLVTGYGAVNDQVTVKQFYDASTVASNKLFKFKDKIIKVQDANFLFKGTSAVETLTGTDLGDDIWGFAGNDTLYGQAGNDSLLGGDGDDVLQGGNGNDILYGGNGNDGLNGNAGNDTFYGQAGNDTLYGGVGDDADTYVFYKGYGQDTVIDTDDSNAIDTLKFVGINSSAAQFSQVGQDLHISGYGNVGDKVIVKQFYYFTNAGERIFQFQDKTFQLLKGIYTFKGTAAADTLVGTNNNDNISGLGGNDSLYGYAGNDTLSGNDGVDVLQGGDGNDILYGGNGDDGLNGNAGNDALFGQAGKDNLYGGIGNDADVYVFYKGYGQDTVIDTDDQSAVDVLKFADANSSTAKFSKVGNDLHINGYGNVGDQVIVKQFYDANVHAGNKKFLFQDKVLSAAQVKALVQQANNLASAMSSVNSANSVGVVSNQMINESVVSLAVSVS